MNWLRKIVITWMVATAVHAPFPVCDGDNLASGQTVSLHIAVLDQSFDLDFVLLGCDLPDDFDDGPLDIDPENGSSFIFGAPFNAQVSSVKLYAGCIQKVHNSLCRFTTVVGAANSVRASDIAPSLPFQNFSFGKLSQSGIAHFHC
ncbi:hypothetical protein [Gimesia sp.]|mgnify:FL=1|uniref:hypothetical protein n=1 Tax=Gimesia sp. TaxID=2024833 RepID=UPI000C5E7D5F|nr:hypothetical protein [Gimesia sp.]MAX37224.1 hypothetical protein [Gimesia sp.]HAH48766.1 hypothetical protein [Planctomycetaceae bacterium]HBL41971.1 hypothetical protein [Planctomycetaceae bacterium]|tara:strand:- start:218 stop:655 length:438 start_codon:yes stop_codon:yes gene_type:complete